MKYNKLIKSEKCNKNANQDTKFFQTKVNVINTRH